MPRSPLLARAGLGLPLLLWMASSVFAQVETVTADKPLTSYKDRNRVLLLFAATERDAAFIEQNKLWQEESAGFEERQLVVVPVLADARKAAGEAPGALAKRYGIDAGAFAVVLLGKDGHDAYHAIKPQPAAALYDVIDAMPMRKQEMKRQPAAKSVKPDLDHDE